MPTKVKKKRKAKMDAEQISKSLSFIILSFKETRRYVAVRNVRFFAWYYFGIYLYPHHIRWIQHFIKHKQALTLGPRDHGKTETLCRIAITWEIVRNRNIRILLVSQASGLSIKSLSVVKAELEDNERLKRDFGAFYTIDNTWEKKQIYVIRPENLKDPTVEAIGIMGAVTGGRFDWIILDDIIDSLVVRTEDQRAKYRDYVNDTLIPLLEPGGRISVIGTRKHFDDVYGSFIKNKMWAVHRDVAIIREPAKWEIVELDEPIIEDDGTEIWFKVVIHSKDRGEVLWPEKWSMEDLLLLRYLIGSVLFNREYQNVIVDDENAIFKLKWLEQCRDENLSYVIGNLSKERRKKYLAIIQGDDPSLITSKQTAEANDSDFHVIWTIGIRPKGNRDLIGLFRTRGNSPAQVEKNIVQENGRFNANLHFLETNAFGAIYAYNLIEREDIKLVKHHTGGNKTDFYQGVPSLAVMFENRKYSLPYKTEEDKQITDKVVEEFHSLGMNVHDDIVMAAWIAETGATRWKRSQQRITMKRVDKPVRR